MFHSEPLCQPVVEIWRSRCTRRRFRVKGGWELVYLPVSADIYNEDLEVALKVMNQDIETLIAGRDAQYQWSYKRFRTLPRGTINHYDGVKRAPHKDPAR